MQRAAATMVPQTTTTSGCIVFVVIVAEVVRLGPYRLGVIVVIIGRDIVELKYWNEDKPEQAAEAKIVPETNKLKDGHISTSVVEFNERYGQTSSIRGVVRK